jgi:site-specific DNA-methyltransferase (cytosine-N4-specific)
LTEDRFKAAVIFADLLSAPDVPKADLVVCSPPYPNAYSYHLYHMTRMLWLDMDQPTFKTREIGSHRKYSSRGKNAATVKTFTTEFHQILLWLRSYLRDKKYACFVVGDSTIQGTKVDNAEIISNVAQSLGYSELARIERRLQATKKAFNPVIGKIKSEKILVLQKR